MALFGNVQVVSLPFTLLGLANDAQRHTGEWEGDEFHTVCSSPVCLFPLPFATDSLSFLYSFTIYIVGSRIGMQIESGAHRIKHTHAARTDRAFELAFLLARMTTTITASAKQRITKQRLACVCFETIYFIQNLFVIRVDLCARAGSTVHSPRSVKRNFHLSLLYCYLDGRQEIVLLVLGSFSPRTRMCAPSTRGQSVRVFVQSYTRCKHKFSTQYGK